MPAKEKTPKIYKVLADVAQGIEAVKKSKSATAERFSFKYRGIDDVYNMISPLLSKHRVITVPTMLDRRSESYETSGKQLWNRVTIKMQYDFMADDGSKVSVVLEAEGSDSGDKGTNKAMSMAHKYAFIQLFHIPTEDIEDADAMVPEPAGAHQQIQAKPMGDPVAVAAPKPNKPTATELAAKMKAAAPPPFHKVEPAVKTVAGTVSSKPQASAQDMISICECGAPQHEHHKDGCLIKGCPCQGFEEVTTMKAQDFEAHQVDGHIPAQQLPRKTPQTIDEWIVRLEQCKTSEELTGVFNVEVPKNLRVGRLLETYGKLFNKLKAKGKVPAAQVKN